MCETKKKYGNYTYYKIKNDICALYLFSNIYFFRKCSKNDVFECILACSGCFVQ